jgi:GntR family transcriptional regulator/MocR family aminotransferase
MTSRRGRIVSIDLEAFENEPLHRQIYFSMRRDISDGALAPGANLPSTRCLASDLGVSRGTAVLAYEQLRAEGYLMTERRSGTRVATRPPDSCIVPAENSITGRPTRPSRASRRGDVMAAAWRESPIQLGSMGPRAFRATPPALDVFPVETWARITARQWRRATARDLAYGDAFGYMPLRRAIAEHLRVARRISCSPEQIAIVAGTQQALDLCAKALLDPGDEAWMEDPGYALARGALTLAGASVVSIRVDGEGLDVADGRRRAPRARLAYVTPSHQVPLGVPLSTARRRMLFQWASETDAWIIEDDYNSEFQYESQPPPSLRSIDSTGRVIYVGTFNKSLFPGLRIGYVVVPPELVPAFAGTRYFTDIMPPWLTQAILAEFLSGGHYDRHLRRLRAMYESRRAALLTGIARHCGEWLKPVRFDSGRELVAWLAPPLGDVRLASAADRAGVYVMPLTPWAHGHPLPPAIRLGYSGIDEADIDFGIRTLAKVLAAESTRAKTSWSGDGGFAV